ncbi:hypothetical protein A1O3_09231 [Capronia epimyces CBS 606.96]|uniref:Uncharacterized protein n=1 Tax=Capronia epimyces CBS 606.96 TaxID=1182542 RepID=W9XL69_9EURO|nr:uncharacterized protein A1O3_09231 [Capronia epimyces CBS 606.96]EXJ78070.1 hypothetical protein A1O3_09231 [Capronia epimyces CBS 606.96]
MGVTQTEGHSEQGSDVQSTTGIQMESRDKDQLKGQQTTKKQEYPVQSSPKSAHADPSGTATDPTIQQSVPVANRQEDGAYNSKHKHSNTQGLAAEKRSGTTQSAICTAFREGLESGKYEIPEWGKQNGTGKAATPVSYGFPPALPPNYRSRHRARFDRACLLPDRKLPFNAQIMEHVKDWADLGSRIEDSQRRKEVLDRAFETLTNVWYEALRVGYDPGPSEPTGKGPKSAQQTRTTVVSSKTKKEHGPGRPPGPVGKSRQKSPSRAPIFISRSHRDGSYWAITAGELQEACVSEERIRQRATSGDLKEGQQLLEDVLQRLGGTISRSDWWKTIKTTKLNPWGRNLLLYSLYEVQMSRQSISHLEQLYAGFSQARQRENTQRRIDEEKERYNLFMALALEVNDKASSSRSSTPPDAQADTGESSHCPVETPPVMNLDPPTDVGSLASIIKLADAVLNETDPANLITCLEAGGLTDISNIADVLPDGPRSILDRTKHNMGALLLHARETCSLSESNGQAADFNADRKDCEKAQVLESKIFQKKKILQLLLPLLEAELYRAQKRETHAHVAWDDAHVTGENSPLSSETQAHIVTGSLSTGNNALKHALSAEDLTAVEGELSPMKKQKTHQDQQVDSPSLTAVSGECDVAGKNTGATTGENKLEARARRVQNSVEQPDSKKAQYIRFQILPKVNDMLTRAGMAPATTTSWRQLREALGDAGVPIEDRNALTREINGGFEQGWQIPEQDASTSAPSGALTTNGDCPQAVQQPLQADDIMLSSRTIPTMEPDRRSLIVKLPLPLTFNPAELSSDTVFSHKGFKYRYTRQSTFAQRKSMDEVLDTYVRERSRPQPELMADWRPEPRFGTYEVLTHPEDPERTSIIHGFWDQRDGSQVQGQEWFYHGDGEMEHMGQHEQLTTEDNDGDSGNDDQTTPLSDVNAQSTATSQSNSLVNKHLKNVLRLKRNSTHWTVDKSSVEKKGRSKSKAKHRVTSMVGPSPLSQSMTTTRSGASSAERAKRHKTKRNHAKDEDYDTEYQPSD